MMGENLLAVTEILEASTRTPEVEENAEDFLSWILDNFSHVFRHLVKIKLFFMFMTVNRVVLKANIKHYVVPRFGHEKINVLVLFITHYMYEYIYICCYLFQHQGWKKQRGINCRNFLRKMCHFLPHTRAKRLHLQVCH